MNSTDDVKAAPPLGVFTVRDDNDGAANARRRHGLPPREVRAFEGGGNLTSCSSVESWKAAASPKACTGMKDFTPGDDLRRRSRDPVSITRARFANTCTPKPWRFRFNLWPAGTTASWIAPPQLEGHRRRVATAHAALAAMASAWIVSPINERGPPY